MNDHKLTITDVAKIIGVVPKTLIRWEKSRKVKRAKRDWRGWRVYTNKDLAELMEFHDSTY